MKNQIHNSSKLIFLTLILVAIGGSHNAQANQPAQSTTPTPPATATPAETVHPTPTAGGVISATVTTTPTVQSVLPQGVLYQDEFIDPASGWPNALVFDNYYIGYHEPTYYHVEVRVPKDKAIVTVPKKTFADFTVESKAFVDPNNTTQTGDFRYGLVFRRSGSQYYAFAISPRTQTWTVLKSSPTGVVELKTGTNDSIQGLKAADALRVDAKGSTFFFHINDQIVGQVSDADYPSGEVGFFLENFDSPRTHIHNDSITIREVEAQRPRCNVVVRGLNVREGPGTTYRILKFAKEGDVAEPLARSADARWLNVRLAGGEQAVWISSAPIYVTCSVSVTDLPVRQP
jgi:hypothetical protein